LALVKRSKNPFGQMRPEHIEKALIQETVNLSLPEPSPQNLQPSSVSGWSISKVGSRSPRDRERLAQVNGPRNGSQVAPDNEADG